MQYWLSIHSSSSNSRRYWNFSINGTSGGLLTAQLYQKPDKVYNIDFYLLDPQDDLTEATTTLTIPEQPVILGAYALALAERGEDGGTGPTLASSRFDKVLSDFITKDSNRTLNETLWYAS